MRLATLKPRLNKLAHRLPTQTTETQRTRGTTGMNRPQPKRETKPDTRKVERKGR